MGRILYVRGFPSSFTREDLEAKFSQYGRIKQCKLTNEGKRLFAIVTFYYEEHANSAAQALNDKIEDEIVWHVTHSVKKKNFKSYEKRYKMMEENRQKTLYLRNFPAGMTEGMLMDIFEKYGMIESVCIKNNVAFITFLNSECAVSAQSAEKLLEIDGMRVYVEMLKCKQRICNFISKKLYKKRYKNNQEIEEDQIENW